jgi:hypothetical protein
VRQRHLRFVRDGRLMPASRFAQGTQLRRGSGRSRDAGSHWRIFRQELLLEFRSRHGVSEIIPLAFFAASALQQIGRGTVLDAFGNDR